MALTTMRVMVATPTVPLPGRVLLMQLEARVIGDEIVLALSGLMTRNDHFGASTERVADLVRAGRPR